MSRSKRHPLAIGMLVALACSASEPRLLAQDNVPPVSASINVSKTELYEKETFLFTLTIRTVGVQIRQRLDLGNLPDNRQVDMFTKFETLPTQRIGGGHRITEIHRYRCRARALTAGTMRIAPTLNLIAMRRRRLLIGSAWEEFPITADIAPITLTVKPLPPPPPAFSGAVGKFVFSAAIDPSDIAVGDLVTLTTRIEGEGYTTDLLVPHLPASPTIKTYSPKLVHSTPELVVHEQVLIPQSADTPSIPPLSFSFFDTGVGKYRTIKEGPFLLTFHQHRETTFEHFRPDDGAGDREDGPKTAPARPTGLWARLRRILGYARYDQGSCMSVAKAHLAPSASSLVTFEIAAGSEINILQRYDGWSLVECERRRGWLQSADIE
jgi:hypothetical protein